MLSHVAVKLIVETAHVVGLVPLPFVAMRDRQGYVVRREWWWMAVALSVSFLADSAAHWIPPLVVSIVYTLLQATLFGAVLFLDPRKKWGFLALLFVAGLFSILVRGVVKPDYILTTIAFGGIAALVYPLRSLGVLRLALLAYFGQGVLYWAAYCLWPSTLTYLLFQGSRVLGVMLFCVAASHPYPKLRLVSAQRAA